MTLGEKIKKKRLELGLSQKELASNYITRNMLSAIESGKAQPSLDTLIRIADGLGISPALLLLSEEDSGALENLSTVKHLRALLADKKYKECLDESKLISEPDDEIYYIQALCAFELGTYSLHIGAMVSAASYLNDCRTYCEHTVYDTKRFTTVSVLYLAVCNNITSPLLELESDKYVEGMLELSDLEFYRYLIKDYTFKFENHQYAKHLEAKQLIKERRYSDAVAVLSELEATKNTYRPDAFLMFGVYTDLEVCYKQLFDFENAYRYSSKRISMLEGFSS